MSGVPVAGRKPAGEAGAGLAIRPKRADERAPCRFVQPGRGRRIAARPGADRAATKTHTLRKECSHAHTVARGRPGRFKHGFLNRVWRFNGAVDGLADTDARSLSMTLESIERLPARFRREDDDLLDQDMTVLFSDGTRVYGPDGRLVHHDELERAESVQVRGRLLRPRKWRANEDGDFVPTVRAKRIYVTAWVPASESDPAEEPGDEWSDDGEPGEGCHRAAARRDAEVAAGCW